MDPFTQRMLERARVRQEKIDQKLASSGQVVPKRIPLSENIGSDKSSSSPGKSPSKFAKQSVLSPKKPARESLTSNSPVKSPQRRSSIKNNKAMVSSPQRSRNDVIVTKKEYQTPKRGSINRRNSDVSVEINIMHRDDIQIEVQVEERDAPMNVVYELPETGSSVVVEEIQEDNPRALMDKQSVQEQKTERGGLRQNVKSRLDRLGNLYSDKPNLSSPIHRTELEFTSATPPTAGEVKQPKQCQPRDGKKKFGRLAALADEINNWEDDLTHHTYQPEVTNKIKPQPKKDKLDSSTLDVSIHSIKDINKVIQSSNKTYTKSSQATKINSGTFTKPAVNECQRLDRKIVAELEGAGYRRVSASQSRLVYDFTTTETTDPVRQEPKCASTTPSAAAAPKMATMVASAPSTATVTKKPSIKKYKAPTPPRKLSNDENGESDKDKENNVVQREENDNDATESCIQTKPEPADDKPIAGSPVVKRLAPKLNGNVDRNSVLSKAAMFEAGSPRAKEKDPAEMSLRERKALFEKNKGAAIVPKAPFGLAPSVKTLHADNKVEKSTRPVVQQVKTPTKSNSRSNSKETISDDNTSHSSVGGIKGKLAALFSKEQTISESTIANKNKQEREKEMEMLQNRFNYKPSQPKPDNHDSDGENSDEDPSEKAPLMGGSTLSLVLNKKPEIIANVPKLLEDKDKTRSESTLNYDKVEKHEDGVVGAQPVKRRNSQDSPIVLSVLDDVKRIKVNTKKESKTNGAVIQQPTSLYPHLSDIETDTSHTQEEYSDCGGSSDDLSKEKLNQSDNWAETSFGRDVMNVVKKNNTSYKKAVRSSLTDSECQSACDSELDDMLDEALDAESEGPTPPKLTKQSTLSSTSFVFSKQFKSPQKTTAPTRVDRGNELVHSVSFYRKMQNSSQPCTPVRTVRHCSPERPPSPIETNVTTVRQRIHELQQEIAKQQTVISQATQALNLCASTIEFSGSREQAEGERLLLLATHRRQACLHEVQRLQVEGAGPAAKQGMASLHINGLTIPLRRDYIRQLNADGAVGHHAVCLVKCRDRVLATSMQLTQHNSKDLHFPDSVHMEGLTSDFKVTVEVYLLQASKEFLPHDVKYHINKKSSSKLLTPKSKASESKLKSIQSPGPAPVRTPQFQHHGYCIFALPQASRTNFTLNKVPGGSPLEGSMKLEIKARVAAPAAKPHAAWLTAFDDVRGLGAWHRRWFQLQAPALSYWKYPDDVTHKLPMGDIDLTTVVSEKIEKAPRDLCARPNTILLETTVPPGIIPDTHSLIYVQRKDGTIARRHLLAADTPKDRDEWLDILNKALEYVRCCSTDDE